MGSPDLTAMKAQWKLKLALSLWTATGFTAIYLLLEWLTVFPVTPVRTTGLDRLIPFMPGAVYLYGSLWLLLPLGLWLIRSREDLIRYSKSLLLISLISFTVFLFFPTSSQRPGNVHPSNLVYQTLIRVDKDRNAFPSLHVALAILGGVCGHELLKKWGRPGIIRGLPWIWCSGLIVSTLLIKQHGVIDALGGAVVGVVSYHATRPDPSQERPSRSLAGNHPPDRRPNQVHHE